MNITIITPGDDRLPPAPCSSVDIYDFQLSKELARRHVVHLYARGDRPGVEQRHGIQVHTMPVRGSGLDFVGKVLRKLPTHLHSAIQVDNRPGYISYVRNKNLKVPLLLNLHSANFLSPLVISHQGVLNAFRQCDAVVANSHYLRRELERRYPDFKAKYRVIYPGADLSQFPWRESEKGRTIRREMRQKYQAGGKTIMLFVGRFLPRKGIIILLQALRQMKSELRGVEMWIVGGRPIRDTPFHRQVRALAQGLPVRFFPFTSSNLVHRYYLAADLFVCPSQLPESFGMVNIEAAASGLPAVGSDAWGIRESIAEGVSGWHVKDFHNSRAWAKELTQLLSDRSTWEKMGRSAHMWAVKSFAWQRVADDFSKLYQSLIKVERTKTPALPPKAAPTANIQPARAKKLQSAAPARNQPHVIEVKPTGRRSATTERTAKWQVRTVTNPQEKAAVRKIDKTPAASEKQNAGRKAIPTNKQPQKRVHQAKSPESQMVRVDNTQPAKALGKPKLEQRQPAQTAKAVPNVTARKSP